jgi:phosphocarrier protein
MIRKQVHIDCPSGLHLRPATAMCTEAQKYESNIRLIFDNKSANAKSILSILACRISNGADVVFEAEGPDEEQALSATIEVLLQSLKTPGEQ